LTGNVTEPFIPVEENLPMEAYFCPRDDCLGQLQKFNNGSCAIYNSPKFQPRILVTKDARTSGLMHNKFCVVNNMVATGSMNPTTSNMKQANNLLVLHSSYVSRLYEAELGELVAGTFGKGFPVQNPVIMLNNHTLRIRFCPEDKCKQAILEVLQQANSSILYALNLITDEDIAAMLEEKAETLDVHGVVGEWGGRASKADRLPNSVRKKIHHKFFVVDNEWVIAGSANPSKAGYRKNDENVIIIHHPDLAKKYVEEVDYWHSLGT
jgi:hypothetical protein